MERNNLCRSPLILSSPKLIYARESVWKRTVGAIIFDRVIRAGYAAREPIIIKLNLTHSYLRELKKYVYKTEIRTRF